MRRRDQLPVVAIVGRTNVGKSTLFNAILGRRVAVVNDAIGVTRDRSYLLVTRYERPFYLCDTGGLAGDPDEPLQEVVKQQAAIAIDESSIVLAVFDGLSGPVALDSEVVDLLRQAGKPVIWVVNKCEKSQVQQSAYEFSQYGIDPIFPVSAAHRLGIRELVAKIVAELDCLASASARGDVAGWCEVQQVCGPDPDSLKIAFVGRPNVGKSTLVNRIAGSNRVVVAPEPGTTRDSIDVPITRDGRRVILIDTAGLRKRARIDDQSEERFSVLRTVRSMVRSDVVALVLDGSEGPPTVQEAKIASLAHERGKGLLLVVNKWDAVVKDQRTVREYTEMIRRELPFARYAPVLFVSGLTGRRCPSILTAAQRVNEQRNQRVSTAQLNRVLQEAFRRRTPPLVRGEQVKLRFATQVAVAPPTFVLFLSRAGSVPSFYERYLKNALRDTFPFEGSDIELQFRRARRADEADLEVAAIRTR